MHKVVSIFVRQFMLLSWLLLVSSSAANADTREPVGLNFDGSPLNVIVEYDVSHNLLPAESTPRLRIFGDGRVEVFYPPYMKLAGRYSYQLSSTELQMLLTELVAAGLSATSTETYQASLAGLRTSSGLFEISDPTTVSVSVNLLPSGSVALAGQTLEPSTLVASQLYAWRSKGASDSLVAQLGNGFDALDILTTDSRMVKQ